MLISDSVLIIVLSPIEFLRAFYSRSEHVLTALLAWIIPPFANYLRPHTFIHILAVILLYMPLVFTPLDHKNHINGNCSDDRGSKHFWNVSLLLRDYTAQYSRCLLFSNITVLFMEVMLIVICVISTGRKKNQLMYPALSMVPMVHLGLMRCNAVWTFR